MSKHLSMHPTRSATAALIALALLAGFNGYAAAQTMNAPFSMFRTRPLVQGTQVGRAMFPPGDTVRGGNGQLVDGIEGASQEMLKMHIHAHLSLFYKGEQIAVPYGIGIVKPLRAENGFVGSGQGFYWLHTHDATGIIHVESPDNRPYTLGNFFDIWGEPLNQRNVAGLKGKVHVFVNGRPYAGDLRKIVLAPHEQITLEVGEPFMAPPAYTFPQGL